MQKRKPVRLESVEEHFKECYERWSLSTKIVYYWERFKLRFCFHTKKALLGLLDKKTKREQYICCRCKKRILGKEEYTDEWNVYRQNYN